MALNARGREFECYCWRIFLCLLSQCALNPVTATEVLWKCRLWKSPETLPLPTISIPSHWQMLQIIAFILHGRHTSNPGFYVSVRLRFRRFVVYYLYIHLYIHTYIYIYLYISDICIYVCVRACGRACVSMSINACEYAHAYLCFEAKVQKHIFGLWPPPIGNRLASTCVMIPN